MSGKLAHPESQEYVRDASRALRHHNLPGGFRDRIENEGGVELIGIHNSTPILLRDYPVTGHWTLHISWTVRRDPVGGSILWRSSVGLNVREVPFAKDQAVSLVRYDYDLGRAGPTLSPLGAHLNVLQPPPLHDRLHFPVMSVNGCWSVSEVLGLFLSPEFTDDIARCLGA